MRIVLISEVAPAVEGLSALLRAEGHDPVALLCVRHDPGRYTELADVLRAAPSDMDVVMPSSRERIGPLLRHFEPDLALCLGFPWKIPPDALAVPRYGIVNGHPSLLPRYRGPSPVSAAIRGGDTEIGFTFHYMDAELDTGNILAQCPIPLSNEHTWDELTPKIATAVGEILPTALARVESGDPGDVQDETQASYQRPFEPDYAWIDLDRTVDEVACQVRAWRFQPTSLELRGALIELAGVTTRVLRVEREPSEGHTLTCADGTLRIVESEAA